MFQQSFAIDNFQKPPVDAPDKIKLINHSKDTEESVEQIQQRVKRIKNLGIIDLESKYLHSNESLNFSKDQIGLAEKIEILEKRQKVRELVHDSRLDDSRKYIIDKATPAFGQKEAVSKNEGS